MKIIKILFLILIIPSFILAQKTMSISGILSANAQWNFDTVYLTGNVTIPNNITLSISAGTQVIAQGYYKIDVKGRLIAIGQPNKFIYFTTLDTTRLYQLNDTSSTRGGWNGLHFESISPNNDSSILKYCRVEHGKAVGLSRKEKLGGGIYIDSCSKILIQNCQIFRNVAQLGGAGIQIVNNASPKIIENLIKNNYSFFEGGGIASLENSAPIIQKNIIIENISFTTSETTPGFVFAHGAGAGIYVSSRTEVTPLIAFNLIANNVSVNGAIYESSPHMIFHNNIIVNNYGGGIFQGHQRSRSIYANNTICNNNDQGFGSSSTAVTLYNNIIRNNIPLLFPEDSLNVSVILGAWPKTRSNNIERIASQLRGNNNIDAPTLFVKPTTVPGLDENGYEADWRLKKGSPEIDAGTTADGVAEIVTTKDFLGNTRIQGAAIDMGAIEYTPLSTTTDLKDLNIKIYPNPFSGQIWIDVNSPLTSAHYSIFSIDGKLISKDILNQGTQLIQTEQFAAGIYILSITDKNGKQILNSKLVKN